MPGRSWFGAHRALVAAALLALACARGGPGSVHVVSVRVVGTDGDALGEAGLDEATIEAAARGGLAAAGFRAGDGKRPYRAEITLGSVRLVSAESRGGVARVETSVELALSPAEPGSGAGAVRETGTAAVALSGRDPREAWRTAVERAARQAADGLALGFSEEAKSVDALLRDLSSEDPRVREHAVRVLADRKTAAAVPALVERLKDEDRRVVHRAVGALALIGDERAVPPLIDMSRSGDPSLTARVARIIGDIGGAEAEGYLLTLEAGHPDPRVREAAREALEELGVRAAEKKSSVAARK